MDIENTGQTKTFQTKLKYNKLANAFKKVSNPARTHSPSNSKQRNQLSCKESEGQVNPT